MTTIARRLVDLAGIPTRSDNDVPAWSPARRRLAALAICTAILTATGAVWIGGSESYARGAFAYILVAAFGVFAPSAITVQVIAGEILAGSLLLGPGAARLGPLALVVAGVLATAELLALVGRLGTPLERGAREELNRAGISAVVGGLVFLVVVAVGRFPGPGGIVAVIFGAAACLVLAMLLLGPRNGSLVTAEAAEGAEDG